MTSAYDTGAAVPALLAVSVPCADAEVAAYLIWEHAPLAVEERDGDDGVLLVAGFASLADLEAARDALGERWAVQVETADDGYLDAWRAFAEPVRIAGRLVVRPAWVPYEQQPGELVCSIEPGRSFGVGNHPSTRLALGALAEVVRAGDTVLDVGCGSGVLAISAVLLGAGRATGIDVLAPAVVDTMANARRNGVADRVVASTTDVRDIAEHFDVVVANLGGSQALVAVADSLSARVDARGTLVFAGMLTDAVDPVRAALADRGFVVDGERMLDGWAALIMRRAGP